MQMRKPNTLWSSSTGYHHVNLSITLTIRSIPQRTIDYLATSSNNNVWTSGPLPAMKTIGNMTTALRKLLYHATCKVLLPMMLSWWLTGVQIWCQRNWWRWALMWGQKVETWRRGAVIVQEKKIQWWRCRRRRELVEKVEMLERGKQDGDPEPLDETKHSLISNRNCWSRGIINMVETAGWQAHAPSTQDIYTH